MRNVVYRVGVSVLSVATLGACSLYFPNKPPPSDGSGGGLECGPGTVQIGNECLPTGPDAGTPDAAPPTDAGSPGTEAVSFGIDPAHDNLATATVESPLAPRWTAQFDGKVSYPLVVSGLVIVAADEAMPTVRALDVHTGATVWGPNGFPSPVRLAYDGGRVFTSDQSGNVTAFDAFTGAQLWSVRVESATSPPVATGGLVYLNGIGGESSETVALDEATGAQRWSASTPWGSDASVAVGGKTAYTAEGCKRLTAWNAETGARLWSHAGDCDGIGLATASLYNARIWDRDPQLGGLILDDGGNAVGSSPPSPLPAFHAGTVFYLTGGMLSAVDIGTGQARWSFNGAGRLCTAPVVAAGGGQVFIGSSSGQVYELDETTGALRSFDDLGTAVTCFSEGEGMALGEDHLVVPAGNELVAY